MAQAAHHARLVAHADLAHVDAHVEVGRQLAHQVAEVDALLGLEVEDRLVAVEEELHRHGVHVGVGLGGHGLELGQGLAASALEVLGALDVLGRGQTLHRLERRLERLDLALVHLDHVAGGAAELDAAGRGHHHGVSLGYLQVARVEPEGARVKGYVDGCYPNH